MNTSSPSELAARDLLTSWWFDGYSSCWTPEQLVKVDQFQCFMMNYSLREWGLRGGDSNIAASSNTWLTEYSTVNTILSSKYVVHSKMVVKLHFVIEKQRPQRSYWVCNRKLGWLVWRSENVMSEILWSWSFCFVELHLGCSNHLSSSFGIRRASSATSLSGLRHLTVKRQRERWLIVSVMSDAWFWPSTKEAWRASSLANDHSWKWSWSGP